MEYRYIQRQEDLPALFEIMAQTDTYYLDTEFIKVNTFRPILGLLQINVNNQVFVLDGVTLNLKDVWSMLFHARLNVFHACGEDLDLIHYYADQKPLDNMFDTQVGLAFLGHGLQLSYQQALQNELGVHVDKGETRSDWLARPLREEQLYYAANDVVYLPTLANTLITQLQSKQLWAYVLEDCKIAATETAKDVALDCLYQDIGTFRHTPRQLMQLQQLGAWREHLARASNTPRTFILKNASMLQLIEEQPQNTFALQKIKDVRPSVVKEHGKTILDLVQHLPDESEWPARLQRPFRPKDNAINIPFNDICQRVSAELGVPAEVLLRKKWVNELFHMVAAGSSEQLLPAYLLGWRYDVLTEPLLQLLYQYQDIISAEMTPLRA